MSWNVNGIRACANKGFLEFLEIEKPDVLCLQETKAWPEQLDESLLAPKGYESHFALAEKKGYSGVAIFVKKRRKPLSVKIGLGIEEFDREGRTIIMEFEDFILINGYFPNGQRDHGRVDYKLRYSREVADQALKLKKSKKKEVIICGDVNTAHHPIDLKNPKTNKKTTGFLPIEREWVSEFLELGFNDIFRLKHGEDPDHYTWWSYRGDCRTRNIGWRIDYFFVTDDLVDKTKKSYHLPKVMGSDHCPIGLELNL